MRKTTLYITGLMALLLLAGGLFFSHMNIASVAAASHESTQSFSKGHTLPSIGISAVRPSGKTGVITLADVQQFVRNAPFIGGPMVAGSSQHPTVVSVVATTSHQVMLLTHGENTGLPDTAVVYYVTLHGPFRLLNANVPQGASIPVSQTGIEVFDAQTGNLLLWGAF